MDSRVELLEQFYKTMCRDKVKLESKKFGFQFIDRLTADHEILDYIQMENHYIHKYRLLHISESRRKILLEGHVNKNYNICLYFDEVANNVLCFNLDNNFRQNNNAIIPELAVAAVHLAEQLAYFGMETLTLKSGRGYHQWCRFEQPIDNRLLFGFMVRIAARTLAAMHSENYDYHSIKINMNPNPRFVKNISLRVFGSQHIRTGSFSYVQAQDGILNEPDSWQYFQEYMAHKTISQAKFIAAYDELAADISL